MRNAYQSTSNKRARHYKHAVCFLEVIFLQIKYSFGNIHPAIFIMAEPFLANVLTQRNPSNPPLFAFTSLYY